MNRNRILAASASALTVGAGLGIWWITHPGPKAATTKPSLAQIPQISEPKKLNDFIAKAKSAPDKTVQDQVKVAQIRLAYNTAQKKKWKEARGQFLQAANPRIGSQKMDPEWGSLTDQASYQATVCLVADGKTAQAAEEFRRFMKERPYSPLVSASFKRLVRLNGGKPTDSDLELMEAAQAKQDKKIQFETSVCGPKTIAYLLQKGLIGNWSTKKADYEELAKKCGTANGGTTIEGMRDGLRALGIESYGYRVNRQDLARIQVPAILLIQDHYVALLAITKDGARVYDPRIDSEQTLKLPKFDDPDFFVNAIVFAPLEVNS